jgi:hypothetical protein
MVNPGDAVLGRLAGGSMTSASFFCMIPMEMATGSNVLQTGL